MLFECLNRWKSHCSLEKFLGVVVLKQFLEIEQHLSRNMMSSFSKVQPLVQVMPGIINV